MPWERLCKLGSELPELVEDWGRLMTARGNRSRRIEIYSGRAAGPSRRGTFAPDLLAAEIIIEGESRSVRFDEAVVSDETERRFLMNLLDRLFWKDMLVIGGGGVAGGIAVDGMRTYSA